MIGFPERRQACHERSRRDAGATFPFSDDFFSALTFAHRAFCARRIAARPLALKGRRVLFFDGPLPL
jgi:hypothetical protein